MKIAYVTTDPVNETLAVKLAGECRLDLKPLEPRDRRDGFDYFVLDWDWLPATSRQDLLKELKARPTPCAIAAHSYHLDESELAGFGICGVKVFRQLTHDTLLSLHPSAGHSAA
jgi:hypothetical protein